MSSLGLTACFDCQVGAEDDPQPDCNLKATFRHNLCGMGVWGAFVLELENGEVVQPWAADAHLTNFTPGPDQTVWVQIATTERDNRYEGVPTCRALGPYTERIGRAVRILCLAPAN
ncbi:MAG: hypothetical protein MUC97_02420 [Bernardetiaceae bacterium]|nr:hypothetical protein [Bernardetiaceae bacterium]